MKKVITISILAICALISSCGDKNTDIAGGDDKISKMTADIEAVRMVNIDGYLYYETDNDSELQARCGVMDGSFTKTVGELEIPKNHGEANFSNVQGYQIGMTENTIEITKALLVSVDTNDFDNERSLEELKELSKTAGVEVEAILTQKRPAIDTATCIGDGKLSEVLPLIEETGINLAIFDHELTANQTRNIENILNIRVIDRTTLILDIFAQRALSKEGRIQVELAQQKYRLPRLAGRGIEMSRLGGGVGTRGPGETKLETDKRHIRRRIASLEEELKELEERRKRQRIRRKKDSVLTAAIVGYTNAGKSTLFNIPKTPKSPRKQK